MIVLIFRPNLVDGPSAAWWVADGELVENALDTEDEVPALVVAREQIGGKSDEVSWEDHLAWLGKGDPRPWGVWELHDGVEEDPAEHLRRQARIYQRQGR